jgi:hypothetical protein
VKGYLAAPSASASPHQPLITYATGASLKNQNGSVASPDPSAVNVDRTRISRSPYIPQFDILSVAGGTEITSLPTTLGTPGATTPSVYYYSDDLDLENDGQAITIVGPVILNISGRLRIRNSSNCFVRITPTGSLRLHISRGFRIEPSGGGIRNDTQDPKKLVVLLSSTGTHTFNYSHTGQPFYGVIYLPGSSRTFSVANNVEIFGAISTQNLTFGSNVQLHYDSALRQFSVPGVDAPCIISDWRELTDPAERISL